MTLDGVPDFQNKINMLDLSFTQFDRASVNHFDEKNKTFSVTLIGSNKDFSINEFPVSVQTVEQLQDFLKSMYRE